MKAKMKKLLISVTYLACAFSVSAGLATIPTLLVDAEVVMVSETANETVSMLDVNKTFALPAWQAGLR